MTPPDHRRVDAVEDEPDDERCPPECERTGMCVRACTPLLIPLED